MIQQSVDGSVFFNRSWTEFKVGFNDNRGNYWLGNDLLHQLTKEARYKLRCRVHARSNGLVYEANYGIILVGSEYTNYTLRVAHYSGNAGDSMSYHNGMMFSTYDRDNDLYVSGNCAQEYGGGFWHNKCYQAGVTMIKNSQRDGFAWLTLGSSLSRRQLQWVTLLLTC